MDQIIKLQSNQSGPFSNTKNLIDFTIPEGGVYSLKDSYINLSMNVVSADTSGNPSIYNAFPYLDGLTGSLPVLPNACLVKNAHLASAKKGQLESIRRVDVLRGALDQYEKDDYQKKDRSYYSLNSAVRSDNMNLSPFRELHGEGTSISKDVSHEVKIKLESLYNIGMMEAFSTEEDVLGQCDIHLECNFDKVLGGFSLGATDAIWTTEGPMDSITSTVANQPINQLITTKTYNDIKEHPFWVGQKLTVSSVNNGAAAVVADHIITGISYNEGNYKMYITFDSTISTLVTVGHILSAITVLGKDPATPVVTIESAELVLSMTPQGTEAPKEFSYTTWSTEEDSGVGRQKFIKQYQIEPEAINMLIAFPLPIVSQYDYTDYRIRVDNKEQTNRAVKSRHPILYDRINRFFLNRGKDVKCLLESVRDWNDFDYTDGLVNNAILETLPVTDNQKLVNVEINGAGLGDLIIFKEITREV
jgi:hypothetical protein